MQKETSRLYTSKLSPKERKNNQTAARSRKIETAKGLLVGVSILKLQKLQSACKFCHLLPWNQSVSVPLWPFPLWRNQNIKTKYQRKANGSEIFQELILLEAVCTENLSNNNNNNNNARARRAIATKKIGTDDRPRRNEEEEHDAKGRRSDCSSGPNFEVLKSSGPCYGISIVRHTERGYLSFY